MRTLIRVVAGCLVAIATAGTAIAADAVPTVDVSGSVVETDGQPAAVESARVEEFETPDSEAVVTQIDVGADGAFTVALREWGTAESPASARFTVFGVQSDPVEDADDCLRTVQPFGTFEIAIPGQVPTEPIVIALDQTAESVICPAATATPEPDERAPAATVPTLPPTDAHGATGPGLVGSLGSALLVAGMALVAIAAFLVLRPSARRR